VIANSCMLFSMLALTFGSVIESASPVWTKPGDMLVPVLKTGRLRWTLAGAERPAVTDDGAAGDLSGAARPAPLKEDYRHA
jgi:hypothetical protein